MAIIIIITICQMRYRLPGACFERAGFGERVVFISTAAGAGAAYPKLQAGENIPRELVS